MDFLKSMASGGGGGEDKASGEGKHSTTELLSSAKIVAEAAKSAASEGVDKVDKAKAAGAASDLVDAASEYGNLTDKGYGKYVDQAKDYLHQYESKDTPPSDHPQDKPPPPSDQGDAKPESAAGDYLKMAQNFLK